MPGYSAGESVRVVFPFEWRGERLADEAYVQRVLSDRRLSVVFMAAPLVEGCRIEQAVVPAPYSLRTPRAGASTPDHVADEFRTRRIFAAETDAVVAIDRFGRVQFWSGAATRLYGWTEEEVSGQSLVKLIVPEISLAQGLGIMRDVGSGRVWAGDFVVRHRDGTQFMTHVVDYPVMDTNGSLIGVVGVSSQIRHVSGTPALGYQVGDPVRVRFPFTAGGENITSEGIVTGALSEAFFRVFFQDPEPIDGFAIGQAVVHLDRFT